MFRGWIREQNSVFKFQHSCTRCIAHLYLRLPVLLLVQMQSGWDRFESFVVLGESSSFSDGIYLYIYFCRAVFVCSQTPPAACVWLMWTSDYYGAPHGKCHKGVDRRRVTAPVESAARFPTLTDNDTMFYVGLWTANTRFWIIVPLQKAMEDQTIVLSGQQHSRCSCLRRCSHYGENDGDGDGNVHGDVNETWGNVHTVHGSMENG